jgi:peroxiredoxin
MKTMRILLIAGLMAVAGQAFLRAQDTGVTAPDFSLKDIRGNEVTLGNYKGKVLFLNFWATWCPPCRAEIPDFIAAYEANKSRGLEILGLSVDDMAADKLQSFIEQAKISYPVALATLGLVDAFRPGQYIPSTIVIDKKGIIRHRHVGQMDKETLLRLFEEYVKE